MDRMVIVRAAWLVFLAVAPVAALIVMGLLEDRRRKVESGPVYMQWHGGDSYAGFDDTEVFATVDDAVAEYRHRAYGGDRYYPCVQNSVAWLFFADPATATGDPYPDLVLEEDDDEGVRILPA